MTATLDDEVAELRRANAELQQRLDEALTERDESLQRETATTEVLQVINSSPGNLTPVFDAVLERAMRLCDAAHGHIWTYDGELAYPMAVRGETGFVDWIRELGPVRPGPSSPLQRLVHGERLVYVEDVLDDESFRANPIRQVSGARTVMSVALRKDDTLLGALTVYRREVSPFSDKQIALLENFASQAVIAMENARLITETREALEQQTATAEVLQVINSSPGDLAPVFEAILEKAHTLCGATKGSLVTVDGEHFRTVAARGLSEQYTAILRGAQHNPPGSAPDRLLKGESLVHIPDVRDSEFAIPRAAADLEGVRTIVYVPLRKDRVLLGYITAYRQEVRPFSDKQIALLQNFAAQAVIAMENARLINETREALEQQTATAEVLGVINASPGDLTPVFDAMLEKALRLCGANFGMMNTYDGEYFHHAADHGVPAAYAIYRRDRGPTVYGSGTGQARVVAGEDLVHTVDLMATEPYEHGDPARRALVDLGGARSSVVVALRKDSALLGTITIYRQEVRPFTDKQIALLENFAAQAVIAMENARLITETREALEQQTATAEVLQVINSSPGDLAPVFDAILEKAHTLCGATYGTLAHYDGETFRAVATRGYPAAFAERVRQGFRGSGNPATQPLLDGARFAHIPDMAQIDHPMTQAAAKLGGVHTGLFLPLRKDDALLGMISATRDEVRPFTDKEIALLQNFAAQAVIAMENARLITETREALEQQTATAEVLQVINSSPGDLTPVFDAMLEKSMRLCEAGFGELLTYDGVRFHTVAMRGVPEAFAAYRGRNLATRPRPGSFGDRVLEGHRVIHILDLKNEEIYKAGDANRRAIVDLGGARTALIAALRKDDAVLGFIILFRQEVRPFTEKQVALLENFAAQAVIAMENARLLDEIHQRQAELRVTFDNMADGVAMFDEDLRLTAWNRNFQELLDLPDVLLAERPSYADYLRILAERGEFGTEDIEAELNRRLNEIEQELCLERTRPDGRVIEVRRNAVPDGGFVLIYSDITERKRSEAEIRAARDAAETAYRDLKVTQASLIQAEKMASLGQLTAGIAHEIKNPLNFVNNFADLSVELLDELKETAAPAVAALSQDKRDEIEETITMLTGNLEKIAEHGRRADGIVKSMLEHSRGTSGERRSVDLNGLIEEALNLAYHGARAQDASFNIALERDFAEAIDPIELVPQDITRVCLNLIGNGFYAATKRQREGSDLSFNPALKVSTRDLGDAVEVRVRDNGTGISPDIKDKLFQPFFTTKPTGEGTGLGLSISYDIVTQEHGGTIAVDSRLGEFTEFTVRLPRAYGATMAEAAS